MVNEGAQRLSRKGFGEPVHRIEIRGDLDRHAVEALYLEIRRLARRYGFDISEFRVEKVTGQTGGSGKGEESAG